MKIKLTRFERLAGIFVLSCLGMAIVMTVVTAVEQGWFASKVKYSSIFTSADGLHAGTQIHLAGLVIGEVSSVELIEVNEVNVGLSIYEKYIKNIKADSIAQITRPFILGEKVVEISVGTKESEVLQPGSIIKVSDGYDIMDLVSGKKLGPFISSLQGLMGNLSLLAEAFADPKRTQAFIRIFDRVDPLLVNLNKMSTEVSVLTKELNVIVPELRKESPELGANMAQLLQRLNELTRVLTPAFQEVGPELPKASRRALEALDEMVVTLKAMQKSFLLSGKVKDVREEESRAPTSK